LKYNKSQNKFCDSPYLFISTKHVSADKLFRRQVLKIRDIYLPKTALLLASVCYSIRLATPTLTL